MTWIKICGITNLEDALTAVEAGADALGFVFYDKSPRNVRPETVREILPELPEHIETVGVFVGGLQEDFVKITNHVGLNAMQLYDGERQGIQEIFTPFVAKIYPCLPMLTVLNEETLLERLRSGFGNVEVQKRSQNSDHRNAIFMDSSTLRQPGGTGKIFDWKKALPFVEVMRKSVDVVIAGGLTSENVAEAIQLLQPWGVDVSSGVEARPGKKDPAKVRAFIEAVRKFDSKN